LYSPNIKIGLMRAKSQGKYGPGVDNSVERYAQTLAYRPGRLKIGKLKRPHR